MAGSLLMACAVKRLSSGCETPGNRSPEAIGAVMEVTKWLKPSMTSVQDRRKTW